MPSILGPPHLIIQALLYTHFLLSASVQIKHPFTSIHIRTTFQNHAFIRCISDLFQFVSRFFLLDGLEPVHFLLFGSTAALVVLLRPDKRVEQIRITERVVVV